MSAEAPELRLTERWFIRRGLPMFVEDYSAGRDVWTRALPVLAALFAASVVSILVLVGDVRGVVVGVAASLAMLLGYAWWNRAHGRPAFSLPSRVSLPWLAAFVVVPPLLELLADRNLVGFGVSLVVGVVVLALVYVVTRYALVALVLWTLRWTFAQLSNVTRLITRVLPLMLLFITFLFINTEVWQVAGTMSAQVLWGSLAVFAVIGVLFIVGRSREEFARIEVSTDRDLVVAATVDTPMAGVAPGLDALDRPVPMGPRQRTNLLLVMVTAQLIQVTIVGALVWAFFVVFGSVAISVPVQEAWLGGLAPVETLVSLGSDHAVTRQLLRVATFLGGFAAFYATVYAASDNVYRKHFVEGISSTLERALAVRRAYLADRRRHGLPAPEPLPPEGSVARPIAP